MKDTASLGKINIRTAIPFLNYKIWFQNHGQAYGFKKGDSAWLTRALARPLKAQSNLFHAVILRI